MICFTSANKYNSSLKEQSLIKVRSKIGTVWIAKWLNPFVETTILKLFFAFAEKPSLC